MNRRDFFAQGTHLVTAQIPTVALNSFQFQIRIRELDRLAILQSPSFSALQNNEAITVGDVVATPSGTFAIVAANSFAENGATVRALGGGSQAVLMADQPVTDCAALLADTRGPAWLPAGTIIATQDRRGPFRVVETGGDMETAGGVRLSVEAEIHDPRDFGWKDGEDLAPQLRIWIAGGRSIFYLPANSIATLGEAVEFDMATVSTPEKIMRLQGTLIRENAKGARIMVTCSTKVGFEPKFEVHGGELCLFGEDEVGWHVRDIRNARFHSCIVSGDERKSQSRGTAWLIENKESYTERTILNDCGAYYCRHAVKWHTSGGVNGGLSFARTIIRNFMLSGGVRDEAQFAISTDIAVSLAISGARDYTIGEIVEQPSTGATGSLIGYPESNDILFLKNVTGVFIPNAPVTGRRSGVSRMTTNVVKNRLPNVYDCEISGIRGNVRNGVVIIDLGGDMAGTVIRDLAVETLAPGPAYYFRDLGNWTFQRPLIEIPETTHSMALFSGPRSSKSSRSRPVYDGQRLVPSEVEPDRLEGVLAIADGQSWNPSGVATGDGGKGLFARLFGGWLRVQTMQVTNNAALADAKSGVNVTGKWLGKQVLSTDGNIMYFATGAGPAAAWKPFNEGIAGRVNIVPA